MSVDLLGQRLVVLNSAEHALELLDKKAAIYSDRPSLVFSGEFVGWNHSLLLLQYGHMLRQYRRSLHQEIGSRREVERFGSVIEARVGQFLLRLLDPYPDLIALIRRHVTSDKFMEPHQLLR